MGVAFEVGKEGTENTGVVFFRILKKKKRDGDEKNLPWKALGSSQDCLREIGDASEK